MISLLPLLTLPFFRKYLDDTRGNVGSIDILGGGLLAATVAIFLISITETNGLLFIRLDIPMFYPSVYVYRGIRVPHSYYSDSWKCRPYFHVDRDVGYHLTDASQRGDGGGHGAAAFHDQFYFRSDCHECDREDARSKCDFSSVKSVCNE